MQGLAIEAMLCAENALVSIARSAISESMLWMAAAYKNLIECVCHAQQIVGLNGSRATNAAIFAQAALKRGGMPVKDIAAKHGVSRATAYRLAGLCNSDRTA
jgi:hypothetical protein